MVENAGNREISDGRAIAERVFDISGHGLTCRFYAPAPEDVGYRCEYEISSEKCGDSRGYAMGEDSVQALLNAMGKARLDLEASDGEVRWLGGKKLGLPGLDHVIGDFTPDKSGPPQKHRPLR